MRQTETYPVALSLNNTPLPLELTSPWQGGTVARYVVVTNVTPYIANLTNTGDDPQNTPALLPGQANKYAWTNTRGPIGVSWTNPLAVNVAPATAGYLTAEFTDDPTGQELTGTFPTSANVINPTTATNIASVGDDGPNGMQCGLVQIPSDDFYQFTTSGSAFPPINVWSWGWNLGVSIELPPAPTEGVGQLLCYETSPSSPEFCDTVTIYEGASDRPGGLITPNLYIVNAFNFETWFYFNFSYISPPP